MNFLDWGTVIGLVAVASFLWQLTRDMRTLETCMTNDIHALSEKVSGIGERVARIEGVLS